jgi:branched-chain amino acid transport system ATP-binding protein
VRVAVQQGLLEVHDVSLSFGGITVLNDLSVDVAEGEICGLVGPNGAGKTSLFNCISRLYHPASGRIVIDGQDITRVRPHDAVRHGVARTFQNVALFPSLTVEANVLCGGYSRTRAGTISGMFRGPAGRSEERELQSEAAHLLETTDLSQHANVLAGTLPFGVQKRIELARAVMARPRLLMLDEPANGLNSEEVLGLTDLLRALVQEKQLTVLLVEHHMGMVVDLCDKVVVMELGKKIAEGRPDYIVNHPAVVAAYLGDVP